MCSRRGQCGGVATGGVRLLAIESAGKGCVGLYATFHDQADRAECCQRHGMDGVTGQRFGAADRGRLGVLGQAAP
jgi:hypothetical protein